MLRQLGALALSIVLGLLWFVTWGPSSGFDLARSDLLLLGVMTIAVWAAVQFAMLAYRFRERSAAVRTRLGVFTWWSGVISSTSLLTGFCLGWMALLLAPAGVITGSMVVFREVRAGGGHDLRNIAGLALCAGAILFLLA